MNCAGKIMSDSESPAMKNESTYLQILILSNQKTAKPESNKMPGP
jgi:hypothetical protein